MAQSFVAVLVQLLSRINQSNQQTKSRLLYIFIELLMVNMGELRRNKVDFYLQGIFWMQTPFLSLTQIWCERINGLPSGLSWYASVMVCLQLKISTLPYSISSLLKHNSYLLTHHTKQRVYIVSNPLFYVWELFPLYTSRPNGHNHHSLCALYFPELWIVWFHQHDLPINSSHSSRHVYIVQAARLQSPDLVAFCATLACPRYLHSVLILWPLLPSPALSSQSQHLFCLHLPRNTMPPRCFVKHM